MRLRFAWLLPVPFAALVLDAAASVYECVDAQGRVTYAAGACAGGEGHALSIDAVPSTGGAAPGARAPGVPPGAPSAAGGRGDGDAKAATGPAGDERGLSREEAARVTQLASAPVHHPEERRGRDLVIAAIRAGVDGKLSQAEATERDARLTELASEDAHVRSEAERALRNLYARHGLRSRARGVQPSRGAAEAPRPPAMPPARGPLSATPPLTPAPLPPTPGAKVDPLTGEILAPAGDHLVDPLTGRMYMHSGRVYVDPTTGRVVPGD